jgi:hypothetical protein
MASMFRLYIRCAEPADFERIRLQFPAATIEPPSEFASVPFSQEQRMLPAQLDRLSRELDAEAIYLAFSSATDALQFTRSVRGSGARHLQYGMYVEEGLWEEANGAMDAWEADAFFAHDALADMGSEDPERQLVEQIYERRLIAVGQIYPMIDARDAARAAAVHYRLTDWLGDWVGAAPAPGMPPKKKPWWRFW